MTDDSERKTHNANESVDEPMKADGGTTSSGWMTRRSALASIGAAAALGSVGSAKATEVTPRQPADEEWTLPGYDVPVLDLKLESNDTVIDVSGGCPEALMEGYETVIGGDGTTDFHPTPSPEQSVIPADLLVPFAWDDRVYSVMDDDNPYSEFDLEDDHLFQSAGAFWTRFVDEYVGSGYTSSFGTAATGNWRELGLTTFPSIPAWEFDATGNDDTRDVEEIRIEFSGEELIGETRLASGIEVIVDGTSYTAIGDQAGNVTVEAAPADSAQDAQIRFAHTGTFTLDGANTIGVDVSDVFTSAIAPLGQIEFYDRQGRPILEAADFATDICEIINPQLSVKVDSIGVGQDYDDNHNDVSISIDEGNAATAGVTHKDDFPITAAEFADAWADAAPAGDNHLGDSFDELFEDASDMAVVVGLDENDNAVTPLDEEANGFSMDASVDFTASEGIRSLSVEIDFEDHRTDVTLGNSGWLAGVKSPRVPNVPGTSGTDQPRNKIGLGEDFPSGNTPNVDNYVRIETAQGAVYQVVTEYESDNPNFNNTTAYLGTVGVHNISGDDIAGYDVITQKDEGASSDIAEVEDYQEIFGGDEGVHDGPVTPATNGYLQIPLEGGETPNNEMEMGDPVQIRGGDTDYDGGNMVLKTSLVDKNIRDQTRAQGGEVLSLSDAYEEVGNTVPTDWHVEAKAEYALRSQSVTTPVQVVVTGLFDNEDGAGTGSPLEERWLDITRDPRVTFEHDGDGTMDDPVPGAYFPAEDDAHSGGGEVTVTVYFDGTNIGDVTFDVVPASDAEDITDAELHFPEDDGGNALFEDNVPAGVEFQTVVTQEMELEGGITADVDVTHVTSVDVVGNDFDVTTFEIEPGFVDDVHVEHEHGYVTVDDNAQGDANDQFTVAAQTLTEIGWTEGGVPLPADYPDDIDPSRVETLDRENIDIRRLYFIEVAANPNVDPQAQQPDEDADSEVPQREVYGGNENLVLPDNLPNPKAEAEVGTIDERCLSTPQNIAKELEESINEAVGNHDYLPDYERGSDDEGAVIAFWGPNPRSERADCAGHSAPGYVVASTTEVRTAFDQDVDVSSVEIRNIENSHAVHVRGIGYDPGEDLIVDPLVSQDVSNILGFDNYEYNTVTAMTVWQEDRYFARGDPLNQVTPGEGDPDEPEIVDTQTRFLGDNELTCNGLECADQGVLLGTELVGPGSSMEEALEWGGTMQMMPTIRYFPSVIPEDWASGWSFLAQDASGAKGPVDIVSNRLNIEYDDLDWEAALEIMLWAWMGGTTGGVPDVPGDRPPGDELARIAGEDPEALLQSLASADSGVEAASIDFSDGPQFYEAFDVVEVKDSVFDNSVASPITQEFEEALDDNGIDVDFAIPDTLVRTDGLDRNLPDFDDIETFSRAFLVYGDRFDGITVQGRGDEVGYSDITRHTLDVLNAVERDWIQLDSFLATYGRSEVPGAPADDDTIIRFLGDEVGEPGGQERSFQQSFQDDHGNEVWFGGHNDTTCETPVEDYVNLGVTAHTGADVEEGDTLDYQVPGFNDPDDRGKYLAVPDANWIDDTTGAYNTQYQSMGLFVESIDDTYDVEGPSVTIGAPNDGAISESYDPEGSPEVSTPGLQDAIDDWRADEIATAELREVLDAWRET